VAKVLVLNCFAADPLRRSWSKKPSIAFWRRDPVQPPFSGTWSPRQFRTSPPPAWRILRVFAATHAKRKMKPSGPLRRGNKKASRFPSWPAWPSIGAIWASLLRLHSSLPGRVRRSEMFKRHRKFRRGFALLGGTDGFRGGHALSKGKRTKSAWR